MPKLWPDRSQKVRLPREAELYCQHHLPCLWQCGPYGPRLSRSAKGRSWRNDGPRAAGRIGGGDATDREYEVSFPPFTLEIPYHSLTRFV